MSAAVLETLEARAGASDQDRPAWLAVRRTGITATEIRDLYQKRITIPALVDRKLGRTPEIGDLSHVPVIGWGNLREPIIAGLMEQRFGIRPESRVFRAADEPRFLASPDGVGVNFDEELTVEEIKTAGKDIAPGSQAYLEKGYDLQQQWVMRVLGAKRSLFVWEKRDVLPDGQFVNGRLQWEWVERDDALIAKLERLARRFLAALDEAAATPFEAPVIDEELDTHALNYLRGLQAEKDGAELKSTAWKALLAAKRSQTSALARITYNVPEIPVDVVDYDAAREDDFGLFTSFSEAQAAFDAAIAEAQAAFNAARDAAAAVFRPVSAEWDAHCQKYTTTKTTTGKPTLRVTAVKTKGAHGGDED